MLRNDCLRWPFNGKVTPELTSVAKNIILDVNIFVLLDSFQTLWWHYNFAAAILAAILDFENDAWQEPKESIEWLQTNTARFMKNIGFCHGTMMRVWGVHCNDVIMGAIASQITSLTIVYSTVYSDADQTKHQSSASLAFVRGIHRGPVNSPHKWPVTRENVSIWRRHHGIPSTEWVIHDPI